MPISRPSGRNTSTCASPSVLPTTWTTLLLGADLPSILKLFRIGRLPLRESSMMRTDGRTNTPPGGAGSTSTRSHRLSWIETSPGSMRSTSRHKGRLPALIFENEIGTRTEFGAPVEAACVNAGTAPQSDANAIGVRTNVLRSMSFFLKQPLRAVLSGSSSYRQRSQLAVNALSSANGPAHGRAVRNEFNGRVFDQHVARCIDERCLQ